MRDSPPGLGHGAPAEGPSTVRSSPVSLATALAATGLAGSRLEYPEQPLGGAQWLQLLRVVKAERLSGLALRAVQRGTMPATQDQRDALGVAHVESMSVAVMLERHLLHAVAALDDSSIPSRVLKGPAVAHLVYPEPGMRPFNDIDMLVPASQFDAAVEVLGAAGFERRRQPLAPGFDARFGKGATLFAPGDMQLDLHRTFVGGRYGLAIRLDDLFGATSMLELGGRTVLGLGPEERFLHACYHAAVGDPVPRLLTLRDIAEMVLHGDLDFDRVQRLAQDWAGLPVLARAVQVTWQTFDLADVTAVSVWASRFRPSKADERILRAYTTHRSGGAQALTSIGAIPGLRSKVEFVRAVALPGSDFLASKHGSTDGRRRTWVRRGLRSIVRFRRRRSS